MDFKDVDIKTPGGGRLRLVEAPQHLGEGALLVLTMLSPNDPRRAEIYLSPENLEEIKNHICKEH